MKYLVDTNILLSHPEFVLQPDIEIILTYKVICELDSKKYEPGTLGLASRTVSRWLEEARILGDLQAGVETLNQNKVFVIDDRNYEDLSTDDTLIEVALDLQNINSDFILLSNDVNVRIKASFNYIETKGWGADKKKAVDYQCLPEILVPAATLSSIYSSGGNIKIDPAWDLKTNCYYIFRSEERYESTAVCLFDGSELRTITGKKKVFGIAHRNVDQMVAIDALGRPEVPLVTMVGKAGSGKTLLAVAAGLEALLEKKAEGKLSVEKLLIIRPPVAMGNDVGFLPGSLEEKMAAWGGSITDNLDVLLGGQKNVDHYFANGTIEIVPPTFMRGRSLNNTFVILDEAQSLTRHEMKTIATRLGENSKLVVTGDLQQIDNPRVSSVDNGLAILIEAFEGTEWASCVNLIKGERSDFSSVAADLL